MQFAPGCCLLIADFIWEEGCPTLLNDASTQTSTLTEFWCERLQKGYRRTNSCTRSSSDFINPYFPNLQVLKARRDPSSKSKQEASISCSCKAKHQSVEQMGYLQKRAAPGCRQFSGGVVQSWARLARGWQPPPPSPQPSRPATTSAPPLLISHCPGYWAPQPARAADPLPDRSRVSALPRTQRSLCWEAL